MADYLSLRIPPLERLALFDLAERRGEKENVALARIIREAVMWELAHPADKRADAPRPGAREEGAK